MSTTGRLFSTSARTLSSQPIRGPGRAPPGTAIKARNSWFIDFRQSQSLVRARKPYFVRNAILGTVLFAFVGSVITYSMLAVKQDDFSDIITPSDAEKELVMTIEDEHRLQKMRQDAANKAVLDASKPATLPSEGGVLGLFKGKDHPSSFFTYASPLK